MGRVDVAVSPEIIQWVLSQTQEEKLGAKCRKRINTGLHGMVVPTFHQIEDP